MGKVIYLLLLPLDFGCADHRADTVENNRADLSGGVLQFLGSQFSFYRFEFRFGLFFGYPGFLGLLLLLGDDVVRPFQMLTSGLLFGRAAFHVEHFGQYGLHFAHVLFAQLAGLSRVVVHPVPYDMGVVVRLPCGFVVRDLIVPLVPMDEDLQRLNAPSFLAYLAEMPQLFHRGIFLDDYHALFDRGAATDYGYLARLLVHPFPVFGLHRPACLFLDHCGYLSVTFFKRGIAQFRRYPFLVFRHEVGTDVYLFFADLGEIFR